MNFWELDNRWTLYHGSNSPEMTGELRTGNRDSGWFGSGFYLTAFPDYAKRWGKYVYQMNAPQGKYAEVQITGNYSKIEFLGEAEKANQEAGGNEAWLANEQKWSDDFKNILQRMGFIGVRVHMNQNKDVEVLVFDPSTIRILRKN
jgi:hypothetical protein